MHWLLKWFGYAAATLIGLGVLAAALVYVGGEWMVSRRYAPQPEPLVRPSAAAIADAPRQARLLGCLSCHGEGLRGNDVFDTPLIGDIIAPNLPHLIRDRSDREIAVAIRQGIGADGGPLLVMPSGLFSRMTPEETSALIAWMRTLPVDGSPSGPLRLTLLGRLMVLNGDMPRQPGLVPRYTRLMPLDAGPEHALGRHIAAVTCAECHGPDLGGGPRPHADFNTSLGEGTPATPDLAMVAAYDLPSFTRLMRTGVPIGGRELGMMAEVARDDFRYFTDEEIAALHGYLQARAAR